MEKRLIYIFLIAFFLSVSSCVNAAEIYFGAEKNQMSVGQQFQLDIQFNTGNQNINAIEGEVVFPSDILELKEIRDANSIINFWIQKPENMSAKVGFSGIIPGGYKGEKGLLFSLIFSPKNQGSGTIDVKNASALLNDGNATTASLSISPYKFFVLESNGKGEVLVPQIVDKERPESFALQVSVDPNLFDGKYFLVFATQDKGSGIGHYEVKEARYMFFDFFAKWITAESPYVLEDQKLRSYISVKAVDKVGNIQVEGIYPLNPLSWYENYQNWITIIILLGFIFIVSVTGKFLWRKYIKK